MTSNAEIISSFELRLLISPRFLFIHLTVGPLPFDLFCFFQLAGYTSTLSGESEINASIIDEDEAAPFSLFLFDGLVT